MSEPTTRSLVAKLAAIMGEIGYVPKDGVNKFHNYKYVTETALVDAVREKLAAAKVFMFTSIEGQDRIETETKPNEKPTAAITTVYTTHTFVDGESGETFVVHGQGQGQDAGDKGVYKAVTGAMKYVLMKNFLMSTGDDPEQDSAKSNGATQTKHEEVKQSFIDHPHGEPIDKSDPLGIGDETTTTPAQMGRTATEHGSSSNGSPGAQVISPAQLKRLNAIASKMPWTEDEVHLLIRQKKHGSFTSRKDITRGRYDAIIAALESAETWNKFRAHIAAKVEVANA